MPQAAREEGSKEKFYGYGVWIAQRKAGRHYFMLGEDPGAAFYSGLFPELDLQVTILGNTVDATWPMLDGVLDLLYPA